MEKRDNASFMLLPGSLYLAVPGELLRRSTTNSNWRIGSTIQSKKNKRLLRQEAIPILSCIQGLRLKQDSNIVDIGIFKKILFEIVSL